MSTATLSGTRLSDSKREYALMILTIKKCNCNYLEYYFKMSVCALQIMCFM